MKKVYQIILMAIPFAGIFSCSKENPIPQLASVNVVNAAINAGSVKVNYFGGTINWASYTNANVGYGSSRLFSLPTGKNIPLLIVRETDTLSSLFNQNFEVNAGDVYSLYLIGQSPTFESLLVKETNVPKLNYPDNTFNVRLINLSPNSSPISINVEGSPATKLFDNVAYKHQTEFNTLAAPPGQWDMGFEVRDANTDALLATYRQYIDYQAPYGARFHSVTLVFRGLVGGSPGPAVSSVNNY